MIDPRRLHLPRRTPRLPEVEIPPTRVVGPAQERVGLREDEIKFFAEITAPIAIEIRAERHERLRLAEIERVAKVRRRLLRLARTAALLILAGACVAGAVYLFRRSSW